MSFFLGGKKGWAGDGELQSLTDDDFEKFRKLIYDQSGISLNQSKKELLRTRLRGRLVREQFKSYKEYYEYVKSDRTGKALVPLLDDISTNLTSFFREMNHFNFLNSIIPGIIESKEKNRENVFRIWSAGCSSGEEPYSLLFAMLGYLGDKMSSWQLKILATDLSTEILQRAVSGLYSPDKVKDIPKEMKNRYFTAAESDKRGNPLIQVRKEYRKMITFRHFNLMTPKFPFKHRFDFIFCRNVMIYFDRPTQENLVAKYYKYLQPKGYLFIGHSESLTGLSHSFKYIQPTIYQK